LHTVRLPFMWVNTHVQDVHRPIATFSAAAAFRLWASSLRLLLDDWQEEEELVLGPVLRCWLPPVGISRQMALGTLLRICMCKYALFRTDLHTCWSLNGLLLFSIHVSTWKVWMYEYLVKCVNDEAFVIAKRSVDITLMCLGCWIMPFAYKECICDDCIVHASLSMSLLRSEAISPICVRKHGVNVKYHQKYA
jgi:hypothetical protein